MSNDLAQLYRQKVLIAKAKCDTAWHLGMIIAGTSFIIGNDYFHSWAAGFGCAAFNYWMATLNYRSELKKATNDYMAVTGYKPDFI